MNEQQANLLKAFLNEFLPPQGNKRKSSNNEFHTIYNTLEKITSKYFHFKITQEELWSMLEELEYNFMKRGLEWNADLKKYKPCKNHNSISKDDKNFITDGHYNINISSPQIKNLRLTVSGLPPNTSDSKIKLKQELIDKINTFMNGMI